MEANMSATKECFSPRSSSGSFLFSILAHAALYGVLVGALGLHFSKPEPKQEYLDLGYQEFEAPPVPEQEEHRVKHSVDPVAPVDAKVQPDNTPKELQDEKGEVAGTQKETKETNLGNETKGTAEATPYYKIKPKYPKAALIDGVEGWVLTEFDITESGEVENVRVVAGEHREMFQNEARRAVEQYKYKPFVDQAGRPIRKTAHQVRVNFSLKDEAGS
jgi:TonB family protein